jgi:nitrile hydratase accessory protein
MTDTGPPAARSGNLHPEDVSRVFDEAWQAQAFALAVHLSETGHFTWPEWSAALAEEIQAAAARGDPDSGYYAHWLRALEQLCARKGLVAATALAERKEDWRRAYLHTPHGQPVELARSGAEGDSEMRR